VAEAKAKDGKPLIHRGVANFIVILVSCVWGVNMLGGMFGWWESEPALNGLMAGLLPLALALPMIKRSKGNGS
jgi:hypothetical protein